MPKRLWPQHFRRDGRAKRAFETKQEAKEANRDPTMHAYKCRFCGKYHIGH